MKCEEEKGEKFVFQEKKFTAVSFSLPASAVCGP